MKNQSQLIIRKAMPKDAKAIHFLKKITFKKMNSKDFTKKQLKFLAKKNNTRDVLRKMKKRNMFCLFEKKKLLGTIDLEGNKISRLYIKWDCMNKGYGSKLLKFIENYAKKKNIKKIKLYSSKYALNFYKNRGYKLKRIMKKEIAGIKFTNREMWKTLK